MSVNSLSNLQFDLAEVKKAEGITKQVESSFKAVFETAQKGNEENEEKEEKKLKKACREIEALFIQQMLKQMKATVPEGGLFPESMAMKIYRDMLDSEYSKIISESPDNLGIAEMFYKELSQTD